MPNPRGSRGPSPLQSQMDSRVLFDHPGQPTREDLTFDHIPFGAEVLKHGGVPGVEYCWVAPESIPKFENAGPSPEGYFWARIGDWRWPINIRGPRGVIYSCQLYGRGEPIPAASPHSGLRKWYVDTVILDRTGHARPAFIGRESTEEELQAQADRVKDTGKLMPGPKPGGQDRYRDAVLEKAARTANSA